MKSLDQVVCIKDLFTKMGRLYVRKGTIHTVYSLFTCSGCGNIGLDLGMNAGLSLTRCRCGLRFHTPTLIMPKEHFRPVDWNDCRAELIDEAMKTKKEQIIIKQPEKV